MVHYFPTKRYQGSRFWGSTIMFKQSQIPFANPGQTAKSHFYPMFMNVSPIFVSLYTPMFRVAPNIPDNNRGKVGR